MIVDSDMRTSHKYYQITQYIIYKIINAVINLSGVSTNKTIIYFIVMQTYKELNILFVKLSEQFDQAEWVPELLVNIPVIHFIKALIDHFLYS
jgi:hypothetical protein